MKRGLTYLLLSLMSLCAVAQQWPVAQPEAKPGARWWWLGSAVNESDLQWNMQEYASHGIGTLEITPLYGVQGNDANNVPFLSNRWMELLRFTEDEGRRDGIQIDMNLGTGWPFGGSDVPLDEAACKLVVVDTVVTAEQAATIQLLPPAKEQKYCKLILQRSFPAAATPHSTLHTPHSTKCRVIALYESRTRQKVKRAAPGGEGYVIDHFDSTAVAHYLQRFERAFAETGTPYPHTFFNDSYEVYGADWTPTLLQEFRQRRGYALEDYLPEFLGHQRSDADRTTADVVSDYRETLSELLLRNFTEQWVSWSHSHGVKVRNQAHGSPANLIDVYAAVDIPEIEGFGLSDFGIKGLRTDSGFTRKNFSDLSMLKYAPSAAHITGKRLTSSETFTWLTEHFRTSLSQMKPDMDLMFCAGVNNMFFHGICYSPKDDPWPGWKFYASVDMSPTNTIWRDAPAFMKYIERCQSFLQWGEPDNDFLVYLPVRDMWHRQTDKRLMQFDIHAMSEKAPDFIENILEIDKAGFDCDYISDRYLLGVEAVKDEKGRVVLRTAAGTTYKALLLPSHCLLTQQVEAHVEALRQQGAMIISGTDNSLMTQAAHPETMKTQLGLNMIRRKNATGYHYFIANLTPNDVQGAMVPLAVDCKQAMWFNPMTGAIEAAHTENGAVLLSLRSGESLILQTFDRESSPATHHPSPITHHPSPSLPLRGEPEGAPSPVATLDGPWTLSFTESVPAIGKTFKLNQLTTWETLTDSTRVLMGTGVYETTLRLKQNFAGKRMQIDLGDVRESARVYINDEFVGTAWAVPYVLTFDGSLLRKGKNTVRIEVTNLPANRIAHLDRQGVKWRKMNEINVVDINYKKTLYDQWTPVPSGLNSSVTIYEY